MKYRKEIDGLRAVAVLSVLLFHAGFKAFSGGFVGVDIFFVISGYLITKIVITEKSLDKFSIINFYERRARRILPALFVLLLVSFMFAWVFLMPSDMKLFSLSLISVSTFTANIFFYLTTDYFQTAAELIPLLHTWSLAVEEQYYFVFPVFILAVWKIRKTWILPAIIFAILISFILATIGSLKSPVASFYLLPTRAWELLFGALLAVSSQKFYFIQISKTLSQALSFIGFVFIAVAVLGFNKKTPFPGVYALIPVLGTSLIILFASTGTAVGKILSNKTLVGIGLISYSTYLWHQPILAFTRHQIGTNLGAWWSIVLITLSLVMGYFSWRYIELPFRNKARFTQRQIFTFAIGCSLAFIFLGGYGYFSEGFKGRFISVDALQATRSDNLQKTEECFLTRREADAFDQFKCAENNSDLKYNVLLIGDSHAASLYPGLREYLDSKGVNLNMMTAGYCLPLVEKFPVNESLSATSRCEKINQKVNKLINEKKFDLIVISSFILHWGFREYWNSSVPGYPGYRDAYLNKIKTISKTNNVLIVGQFITWPNMLPKTIFDESISLKARDINDIPRYSSNGVDDKLLSVDNFLKADALASGTNYISIVDALCEGNVCMRYLPDSTGEKLITFDYGHLGLEASRYISQNIVGPEILKIVQGTKK